jgi:hypothetical protein
MNLKAWEATIQNIVDEIRLAPKGSAHHRILGVWRAKLEKKPTSLPPFQIDEIVREVRKRVPIVNPDYSPGPQR